MHPTRCRRPLSLAVASKSGAGQHPSIWTSVAAVKNLAAYVGPIGTSRGQPSSASLSLGGENSERALRLTAPSMDEFRHALRRVARAYSCGMLTMTLAPAVARQSDVVGHEMATLGTPATSVRSLRAPNSSALLLHVTS